MNTTISADILRLTVMIIGAVIILCVLGMVYLVAQERGIPATFETITVAGITGLLGLLVKR